MLARGAGATRRRGLSELLVERVDEHSVATHFPVDVRAAGLTRQPHERDGLTLYDVISDGD
jgi:hypothetical protein